MNGKRRQLENLTILYQTELNQKLTDDYREIISYNINAQQQRNNSFKTLAFP
ncbi:hypothetical protein [Litchfieldia salsa]|uniref:Uncharacterized protein n=1 Tax=Litchfieldia salsa TaxID=930152 RepID=A0A1H0THY2_9BACI|nr:hypothetical protein SAMN05216565_103538 [Litchfieldia salsa]